MYADTKPFVYNYAEHVVLLMVMEHAANKLNKKKHTHSSYNESQRDALFLKFILIKNSTCFGHVHCPSSGVSQHCIHAFVHTVFVILVLLASASMSETCRVLYQINLRKSASCWLSF